MNNKIISVTKNEAKLIKVHAIQNREIYFAEIDGGGIKTEEDYVRTMADAFAFPHDVPEMKLGWYNDYINDLMLVDNLKLKNDIMADFEEIILPWWEGEVVGHMVGGAPGKFLIYLESKNSSLSN